MTEEISEGRWETNSAVLNSGGARKLEHAGWEPFGAYYITSEALSARHPVVVYRRFRPPPRRASPMPPREVHMASRPGSSEGLDVSWRPDISRESLEERIEQLTRERDTWEADWKAADLDASVQRELVEQLRLRNQELTQERDGAREALLLTARAGNDAVRLRNQTMREALDAAEEVVEAARAISPGIKGDPALIDLSIAATAGERLRAHIAVYDAALAEGGQAE